MKKLLIIVSSMFCVTFGVFPQQNDFFEYEVVDGTITITGFLLKEREIKIPDEIDSIPVTAIGHFPSNNQDITHVVFPEGLKSIGGGAFSNNRISSINFPDSIEAIHTIAFQRNFLEELILPKSLTHIGQMTFIDNRLRTVILPEGILNISDGAFNNNLLTEIVIPGSLTRIGNNVFTDNPLEKITIGENVEFYTAFEESFFDFYNENGKRAGVYQKIDGAWVFMGQ